VAKIEIGFVDVDAIYARNDRIVGGTQWNKAN
jgi:hypothetical protein